MHYRHSVSRFLTVCSPSFTKLISHVETDTQVVEEVIVILVHQSPIDWLLPNVKPTNRRVTFPLVRTASLTLTIYLFRSY